MIKAGNLHISEAGKRNLDENDVYTDEKTATKQFHFLGFSAAFITGKMPFLLLTR